MLPSVPHPVAPARHPRVLRKVPEMLEPFAEQAVALLSDRNHGVMLAGAGGLGGLNDGSPAIPTQAAMLRTLHMHMAGLAAGWLPHVNLGMCPPRQFPPFIPRSLPLRVPTHFF